MSRFKKLSHTIFECKYHIVFCPKYRFRIFRDEICEYAQFAGKSLIQIVSIAIIKIRQEWPLEPSGL
jgi:putative transposase